MRFYLVVIEKYCNLVDGYNISIIDFIHLYFNYPLGLTTREDFTKRTKNICAYN